MIFADLPRCAGLLMPLTSLPGGQGCGDAGAAARDFVDWLASGDARVWQLLPIVTPGLGDSPYASPSAFALSPLLIPLDDLVADGLLQASDLDGAPPNGDAVDYAAQWSYRGPLLAQASAALWTDAADQLETFAAEHPEIGVAAQYLALRQLNGGAAWWRWSRQELHRDHPLLAEAIAVQFLAHRAWSRLRAYANCRGVALLGDLPIGIDRDSADVWHQPELFAVDGGGALLEQQGVPPDAFSASGQLWRMPCLDWPAHQKTDFVWWRARVAAALKGFDMVRIDHFRGLDRYFAIPGDHHDARAGRWRSAPGAALLARLRDEHGPLPLVAEDLGIIDEPVRQLRDRFELPGMHVLQFVDPNDPLCPHRPENHRHHGLAYWGTHDNETAQQWLAGASQGHRSAAGLGASSAPEAVAEALNASPCRIAVHRLADLSGGGAEARINRPGSERGQWRWRHQGPWPCADLFRRGESGKPSHA